MSSAFKQASLGELVEACKVTASRTRKTLSACRKHPCQERLKELNVVPILRSYLDQIRGWAGGISSRMKGKDVPPRSPEDYAKIAICISNANSALDWMGKH
ncbi:Uu.00g041200.m01.CDS01 [Anthostomella pinea]|uniref:Uu.00g041200.m01.CDS01 n=1 Tax=Anthostomella pinea TaxID=933095 RepID=A0AAI8VB06_9PEZI|nr:Uu.00g041200.m01.CDS01 [Anthostomella pinea]